MAEIKERPIIFSAAMVRAILDGRKFQTRRIVKPQPDGPLSPYVNLSTERMVWARESEHAQSLGEVTYSSGEVREMSVGKVKEFKCPFGVPGDRLRVKEAYRFLARYDEDKPSDVVMNNGHEHVLYEADQAITGQMQEHFAFGKKRSSLFMPSDISRITLEVTEVRVQRLQDISDEDAMAEGVGVERCPCLYPIEGYGCSDCQNTGYLGYPKEAYKKLWESINGPGSWNANPFVWPISFERLRGEQ